MAETPDELAQDLQNAEGVLEYRPNLTPLKPLAQPGTGPSQADITASTPHVVQTLALTQLAAWHDLQMLKAWMATALPLLEQALANDLVQIGGDAVSEEVANSLITVLGKSTISLGDVKNAHLNPNDPISGPIKRLWSRYQFGYSGSIAGSLYIDLWRLNQYYLPQVEQNLQNVIKLSGFGITGQSAHDPIAQLVTLASTPSDIDVEHIVGYQKITTTIASQVSDVFATTQHIARAIDSQSYAGATAGDLLTALTGVLPPNPRDSALGEVISVLKMIRTLFEVQNDLAFFSLASLEQRLDQLVEQLLMMILGEAAAMYSHLESMLMTPVMRLVRKLDRLFKGAAPKVMDDFADKLTILLNGVTSKFQAHMLDMYRHSTLHNSLTSQSVDQHAQNNSLRNLVQTIDLLIDALEAIEEINWKTVIGNIVGEITRNIKVTLPSLPKPAQSTPTPDAPLQVVLASGPGLSLSGTPADTASGLLANIQNGFG